jgi:hypothetical protein
MSVEDELKKRFRVCHSMKASPKGGTCSEHYIRFDFENIGMIEADDIKMQMIELLTERRNITSANA